MTLLAGDSHFTAYTGAGPTSTDGGYLFAAPAIASSNGQVTTLNSWITPGTATQFVMGLYDGVNQRLAYSGPITASSAGLVSFPISATPVTAGRAYQLLLISNTGNFQFGVDGSSSAKAFKVAGANLSFPTPPYSLAGPVTTTLGSPAFYADGDAQAPILTTSGTVGQTSVEVATIIARAFNRCRLRASVITDEMTQIAREELFLLLTSELANRGPQLFAVEMILLPFTTGLAGIQMPAGTIDVLRANYRFMNALQSSAATGYSPTTATTVNTVGITWSGPAVPIQILMNGSVLVSAIPNGSAGQTTLYDIDGGVAATSWQVIANPVPSGQTLNISKVVFYSTLFEIPMDSYSRDEYAELSNPFFQSRPLQYWLDRQEPWPILRVWPTPTTNDAANACVRIWRHRHIQDVGSLTNRLDIPVRWLSTVIDGLAYRLSRTIIEVDPQLTPALSAEFERSFGLARGEEREKARMRIIPQIYPYTR